MKIALDLIVVISWVSLGYAFRILSETQNITTESKQLECDDIKNKICLVTEEMLINVELIDNSYIVHQRFIHQLDELYTQLIRKL